MGNQNKTVRLAVKRWRADAGDNRCSRRNQREEPRIPRRGSCHPDENEWDEQDQDLLAPMRCRHISSEAARTQCAVWSDYRTADVTLKLIRQFGQLSAGD